MSWLTRAEKAERALSAMLDLMRIVRSPGDRARLVIAWLVLSAKPALGLKRDFGIAIGWNGPRSPQRARFYELSDLRVLRQVFADGEYDLGLRQANLILDLGANIGLSVLYFRDVHPQARIIAVEPSAKTFARLTRNVGALPNVDLVQAAIGGNDEVVRFYAREDSWASSVHPYERDGEVSEVQSLTVETVLRRVGAGTPDLIKMDIEGAENAVLEVSPSLRDAELVVFEFHQEHSPESLFQLLHRHPEFEVVRTRGDSARHPLVTMRAAQSGPAG